MNRTIGYGAASLTVLALLVVTTRNANTQISGSLPAYIKLQATTPGTAQTGNSNITGTAIAGQHVGGGAGLTGVNADLIDGHDSSEFLSGIPNPLILSGTNVNSIVSATNTSIQENSAGLFGASSGASGNTVGVWGQSVNGRGVYGKSNGFGGFFESTGNTGIAVFGQATNSFTAGIGVKGVSLSPSGIGVWGDSAGTFGGLFQSNQFGGVGVRGVSSLSLNFGGIGVEGFSNSSNGKGVYGRGGLYGGYFESDGVAGIGVFGQATINNGATIGVYGKSNSPSGLAGFFEGPLSATGLTTLTGGLKILSGSGVGRVLTSDTSGVGTWQALSLSGVAAGGDLSGTYPDPTVAGLQGRSISGATPTVSDVLTWNGTTWAPAAPSMPNPLALIGTNAGSIISGQNDSPITFASGVSGFNSSSTGATIGVFGESASTSGMGVYGKASFGAGGSGFGGFFENLNTSGIGVFGRANATSGTNFGGQFRSLSTSGTGVLGIASAASGNTIGGSFESASTSGKAVYGFASAASGSAYAGFFESMSPDATGVAGFGGSIGGAFQSTISVNGLGVWGTALGQNSVGGFFQSVGSSGIGVQGLGAFGGKFEGTGNSSYGVSAEGKEFGVFGKSTNGGFTSAGVYGEGNGYGVRGVGSLAGVFGKGKTIIGNSIGVYGEGRDLEVTS